MQKYFHLWLFALIVPLAVGGLMLETSKSQTTEPVWGNSSNPQSRSYQEQQKQATRLKLIAQKITVRVSSPNTIGSGTIIGFQKPFYQVLTNAHVIRGERHNLVLMTADQRQYPIHSIQVLSPYDLALLTFQAPEGDYPVANLGDPAQLRVNDFVLAAGFPQTNSNPPGLAQETVQTSPGFIYYLAPRSLKEGYRIGYTNLINKGMSGGPLLNGQGEVIGINGIHAEPLWGDSYDLEDRNILSALSQTEINSLSWAIPLDLHFLP
jgi:S1-C subfamily serine protease